MKLRTKLTVSLLVVAAIATAAIGWFAYAATATQLNSEIDRSLSEVAAYASTQRDGPYGSRGHDQPTPTALLSLVQVLDQDGSVVSSPTGLVVPVTSADRAVATGRSSGGYQRDVVINGASYRVLTTHSEHGAVQAVRPLAERDGVLNALRSRILAAAAVLILFAGVVGWLLARQITRRLSRLADAAQTVATTGRLDVPIDEGAKDEAGLVATAFAHMLQVLNRSQLAQRQLAQDAGHELRTPLTSLRTNLDVLARHPGLNGPERAKIVSDLTSETQELNVMLDELLDLTAGDTKARPAEEVRLGRAVTRVVDRARRRSARQFTVQVDRSVVLGNSAAVERAVSNLLDNAVKFSPAGSPVEVAVEAGRVTVRDHGRGVSERDLPRVFDRFYRADEARALPGSGLGLAIVHDVAETCGGQAFVMNHPSGGAQVGFMLPPLPPVAIPTPA